MTNEEALGIRDAAQSMRDCAKCLQITSDKKVIRAMVNMLTLSAGRLESLLGARQASDAVGKR